VDEVVDGIVAGPNFDVIHDGNQNIMAENARG